MKNNIVTVDGVCDKCGQRALILKTHIGKKHKSCKGRKQDGSSRKIAEHGKNILRL